MKRFTYILTFLMLAVIPFTACTEDPEESTGSISGYVTGSSNGSDPLSGVSVSILSTGQSTTTGSDGTFVFRDMQPGSYSLQFKKSGYDTTTKSVTVVAGMNNQCDVQMSKENHEADIVINPSSLNFGTTQTDMSVTIKNNGNATAEWSLNLGDNNWLSASQLGGSIQANRTQSITFTVNRSYLSEQKTVVVNLQAFGNSFPITISCAPKNITSTMTVE
ncbi:MAG: carboxypeptidase regulatory-like domain-containing protein, partial [Muribaculaceae bacterium]|nr:carboxypeptidase regulatory-like domain-containing protein [Muribaculaceae bacterium]